MAILAEANRLARGAREVVLLRGFVAPALVVIVTVAVAVVRPEFLDLPALLLTLGGSIAVILFTYTPRQLRELVRVSRNLLGETLTDSREFAGELARLAELYRAEGLRGLELAERRLQDSFLRRAAGMLVDLQKEENISASLEAELSDAACSHRVANQILLTFSRTLPAFGLIGTLVGMVLLLRDLYTHDVQSLPAALSLAVLTTLYGAVFANVLVAPFAARLSAAANEKEFRMRLTIDWAMGLVRHEAVATAMAGRRWSPSWAVTRRPSKDRGWVLLSGAPQRERA
jgi:chemotaxis protein MotA